MLQPSIGFHRITSNLAISKQAIDTARVKLLDIAIITTIYHILMTYFCCLINQQ